MKKSLLAIGILLLSMQNISAMRQFSGRIRNHALDMRQRFLVGQLRRQQQQRYVSSVAEYDWSQTECYQQLIKYPLSRKTYHMVNKKSKKTKQALLETAADQGAVHPQVWVTLVEAGADINKPNTQGKTPLHRLAESSNQLGADETDYAAILSYIAHFKPGFERKDNADKRPRDYANADFEDTTFTKHDPIPDHILREMY